MSLKILRCVCCAQNGQDWKISYQKTLAYLFIVPPNHREFGKIFKEDKFV